MRVLIANVGEGYLLAGRIDDAFRLAKQALQLSRDSTERGNEAWALRLLAETASHTDPPNSQAAQEYYYRGIAQAHELGMRPVVAHCHLGLGKLYHRTGKREQAREHLGTATAMYRDMGMTYWLEQAEAEIRDLA